MGHGSYSTADSMTRSMSYKSMDAAQIFSKRTLDSLMDPKDTLRECRDSQDHPETVPIIIALDVTGSMGYVPDRFIREEMTKMMASLYSGNVKDAQVLFMGIGDHECDQVPLQVGQFEADDQLLDRWLKSIYLEGGGGGNAGESYLLAWYYAARNTKLDSIEKHGKKGFLFTIGDEPTLLSVGPEGLKKVFGKGQFESIAASELYVEASKMYEVHHLHILETSAGSRIGTQNGWKELIGDHVHMLKSYKDIASTIAGIVTSKATTAEATMHTPIKSFEDML